MHLLYYTYVIAIVHVTCVHTYTVLVCMCLYVYVLLYSGLVIWLPWHGGTDCG